MLKKIDHIGIAVNSLEEVLPIYRDLFGREADDSLDFPSQKVKIAFFSAGESSIELLEPTSDDSPISKFLQKRGPGVHHICYRVENLDESIANLKEKGYKPLDETPRPGAHNTKVCFFHPKQTGGVLIELSEKLEG